MPDTAPPATPAAPPPAAPAAPAALAAPAAPAAPAQPPSLTGYGTFLTGALIGQDETAGGGQTIDEYLDRVKYYDPNASIETVWGSEGQSLGQKINYDITKLPTGANKAIGGGVEISDPSSHWGGSDSPIINQNAVQHDPFWGTYTSMTNISEPEDNFDKYGMMATMATIAVMSAGAASGLIGGAMAGAAADGGALAAEGTGAFDMAGSLGTGMVTGNAAGEMATAAAEAGGASVASATGTGTIFDTMGAHLTDPSWLAQQAVRQGIGVIQNGGHFDPVSSIVGLVSGSTGIPGASAVAGLGLSAARGNTIDPLNAALGVGGAAIGGSASPLANLLIYLHNHAGHGGP
ncbi:MAG: hypothetical protein ACMG51_10210 [Ginsengibacter sp.]